MSAAFFSPHLWLEYAGADLLIALTYAMVGVLVGPLVGRLGGLYVLLLLTLVDVGYGQTVMFHPVPPTWGAFLPGRGAGRLLLDGAFTSNFEQYGHLLLALGWLVALSFAAVLTFRQQIGVRRQRRLPDTLMATGTLPRAAVPGAPSSADQHPSGVGESSTGPAHPAHTAAAPVPSQEGPRGDPAHQLTIGGRT